MKQGETLALNERIMLSLVSTGQDCPFIGKPNSSLVNLTWLLKVLRCHTSLILTLFAL